MSRRSLQIRVFNDCPLEEEELPPGFVSAEHAALYLDVSPQTIRRWIAEGKLNAVQDTSAGRFGWRWMVTTAELIAHKNAA
jgi:excisionase family DNA binding protein